MKKPCTTYCLFVFLIFLSVLIYSNSPAAEQIGLLAGSNAGTYMKIAQDIRSISADTMNINVKAGGSLGNVQKLLTDRNSQFAIVQFDALVYKKVCCDAYLDQKIKMIFPLYNEEIHLIVRKGANIKTVEDLRGKRVNMDKKLSGCWVTALVIKKLLNLEWKEYNEAPADALQMMFNGELDAFWYTVGCPAPVLEAITKNHIESREKRNKDTIELISLVHPKLKELYLPTQIAAGSYSWQEEPIQTYATKAVLVTYNYTEGGSGPKRFEYYVNDIRRLISVISENLETLRSTKHEKWQEIDPMDYTKVKWPIHYAAKEIIENSRGEAMADDLIETLKKFR